MFEFEMRFLLWDAALGAASSQLAAIHEYCEDKQQRAAPKPYTSLKTDAMGCCARRFPQQYTSIARTSNNAQRPFHRFYQIKKCPVGELGIPPGTNSHQNHLPYRCEQEYLYRLQN